VADDSTGSLEFVLSVINEMSAPLAAAQAQLDAFKAAASATMGGVGATTGAAGAGAAAAGAGAAGAAEGVEAEGSALLAASENAEKFQKLLNRAMKSAIEVWGGYEASHIFIEAAAQMQESMTGLEQATGATSQQLAEMKQNAQDLSTQFNLNSTDIVDATGQLYAYIGATAEIPAVMQQVAQLARGTSMSVSDATDLMGSGMANFSDKTKTAAQNAQMIADKIALLENKYSPHTRGGVAGARNIATVLETAKQFKSSLDQAFALLAILNQSGKVGERGSGMQYQLLMDTLFKQATTGKNAGTDALQRFFAGTAIEARTPSGGIDLVETLERLKAQGPDAVSAFEKSLGQAGEALAFLMDHLDEAPSLIDTMANASDGAGASADAATKAMHDWDNAVGSLGQAWHNLRVTIGTPIIESTAGAINHIADALSNLNDFLEAHPLFDDIVAGAISFISVLLILVGALGIIGVVASAVSTGFEVLAATAGFAWAVISAPVTLVIAAIALVGVAIYELIEHWKAVSEFIKNIWDEVVSFLEDKWHEFIELITNVWNKDLFAPGLEAIHAIGDTWKQVIDFMGPYWSDFVDKATAVWNGFIGVVNNIIGVIDNVVGKIEDASSALANLLGLGSGSSTPAAPGTPSAPLNPNAYDPWTHPSSRWGHLFNGMAVNTASAGMQNNNPGDLMVPGTKNVLQHFDTINKGLKAQADLLQSNYNGMTLHDLIYKYGGGVAGGAPTELSNVEKMTHWPDNIPLDLTNKDTLDELIASINSAEGTLSATPKQIGDALDSINGNNNAATNQQNAQGAVPGKQALVTQGGVTIHAPVSVTVNAPPGTSPEKVAQSTADAVAAIHERQFADMFHTNQQSITRTNYSDTRYDFT